MAETFLLPHPWEPLILASGKAIEFRVMHYLVGLIQIKPRSEPEAKTISALRIWPFDTGREHHAAYWDFTYSQVREALLPWLENTQTAGSKFHIQANAHGLRKNFTITVTP